MSGAAVDDTPDFDAVRARMVEFEKNSGWTISAQGKAVVHALFDAGRLEKIGLISTDTDDARSQALKIAYENLPNFLAYLTNRAQLLRSSSSTFLPKEIGALLIVQNINDWIRSIDCPIWPS